MNLLGIKAWLVQWGLVLALAVAGLGWAAAGVQTLRMTELKLTTAQDAKKAADEARERYAELAGKYRQASADLVKTQGERDAARKATSRKVVEYITRPAAAVQCLDDDGLRIIADLGRGRATGAAESAGPVPGGASAPN